MADQQDARLQYEAARKTLIEAMHKKRAADKALIAIEVQIYNFEGSYLAETAQHNGGNIIQGFDGYLKNQATTRRRPEPGDADRIFSNSSATYRDSLDTHEDGQDSADDLPSATAKRDRGASRKRRATLGARDTASGDEAEVSKSGRPAKRARIGGGGDE